jgi:aspartyl protease/PDZ domain-containing protein
MLKHISHLLTACMLLASSIALTYGAMPPSEPANVAPATGTPEFQSTTVPFTFEDNRIFVKCMINGQGPFDFVVDTGGDLTIDRAVAQRLQLYGTPAGSVSGAGSRKVPVSAIVVASVDIGRAHARNQQGLILDLSQIRKGIGLPRLDGIVGYSMLKHYVVEVDMDRHVLVLSRARLNLPAAARTVQCTVASGFIFVPGRIEGVKGTILIDTGDRSSLTVYGPFATQHNMYGRFGGVQDALTGFGIGGPVYGDVFTLPQLDVLGTRLNDVTTRASRQKGGVFASNIAAASIGGGVLRRFNIVYDYPHSTLYVWQSALYATPDSYDRAGFWISLRDDHAYVASVLPEGPASKAGLQPGDEIVTVNGQPISSQDLLTLRTTLSTSPPGTSITVVSESHGKRSSHEIVLKQLV